jgi:hypothetical protein
MSFPVHTVTFTHVVTTTDGYGDSTTESTSATVDGVLFAPEGLAEGRDGDAPVLVGDATLYGVLPAVDSDDTVTHSAPCCDGSDFALTTWQVVGGSKGWGLGDKAVAIVRSAAA